jgi:ABC-2 type transport system permease protein/sodium transport system permease protein
VNSNASGGAVRRSSVAIQWVLTRKELRETLRDRRTLVTLFAMPLLLYPLLGLVFRLVALQTKAGEIGAEYRVAAAGVPDAQWLSSMLNSTDVDTGEDGGQQRGTAPRFVLVESRDPLEPRDAVARRVADVGVRVRFGPRGEGVALELWHDAGAEASRGARRELERRVDRLNIAIMGRLLADRGLPSRPPVGIVPSAVETRGGSTGLLDFLPLILLLMTVTGGVYPAIDLTAGERERDTLETLFALPVSIFRILLAKYIAVLVVTLLTGTMNLIAMAGTISALGLGSQVFGEGGFGGVLAAKLALVMVFFAMFYSAVLLALTSAARSFKEAQAYLIPLMLLSIAPAIVVLLPGWNLSGWPAVMPLLNMLLLARDTLGNTRLGVPAALALASTAMYTVGALGAASRWFAADAVATGSRGGWSDWLRRPAADGGAPDLSAALALLVAMFPAHFFAAAYLGQAFDGQPKQRLVASGLLTVLLFAGLPILAAWWRRFPLRDSLGWVRPRGSISSLALVILLVGCGAWPVVYELVLLMQAVGIQAVDEDKRELVEQLLAGWRQVPLPLLIACLGVAPGVCEELFFRGWLFGAVRRSWGGWASVLATGLVFGVFHVVLAGGAAPERLAPSTVLGILLGWCRWRSGSVWPGLAIHVAHNSTLLAMAAYRDELAALPVVGQNATHLPGTWLAASAAAILLGVTLLAWTTRQRDVQSDSN